MRHAMANLRITYMPEPAEAKTERSGKQARKDKPSKRSPFPPKNRNPIKAIDFADGSRTHIQYDPVFGTYRQVGRIVKRDIT